MEEIKMSKISRRDFIKGSAAGALSIAALGLLGACSNDSPSNDNKNCENQGLPTDWLGLEPSINEADVVETYDTEVLVVGAGTAGLFAACSAVEEGAATILIEKFAESFGGSGVRDTLAAIGSKQQIESGHNPDKFKVINELYRQSNGYGSQKLYKVWAENSGEAIDWYTERLNENGMEFKFEIDDQTKNYNIPIYDVGHSIQWGEKEYSATYTAPFLKNYGKNLGLEIHYETSLIKCIKEGNKVVGIYASKGDKYVRYNASKGVIICTGGYSINHEMMKALQPQTLDLVNVNSSFPGSQGDGIKACLWAGADMDKTHAGMIFDRGAIKPDALGNAEGYLFWMGSQPFLKVDLLGNRFTNESGCYDHILHESFNIPNRTYAMVWDANWVSDIEKFDTHGCSRMYPHANGAEPVWPIGMHEHVVMPQARDDGYVVSADTIEELAQKLGLDVDNFKATVERYNELCSKGVDEDFNKEPHRLSPLTTAPFEGVRMSGGYFICTLDGIRIDENMNALTPDGQAIEGLYCAGDCSGGYFDTSYPNLLAGAAAGRSVTFGRLAGKYAARRA